MGYQDRWQARWLVGVASLVLAIALHPWCASAETAVEITLTAQIGHTIHATAGEHGTIVPLGEVRVAHGANQSFTITPEEGYKVADVLVDGQSVGAVTEYEFQNVTAGHTIHASFEPAAPPQACSIQGWGTVYESLGYSKLSVSIVRDDQGVLHKRALRLRRVYRVGRKFVRQKVDSQEITSLSVQGNTATIEGTCTLGGKPGYDYRAVIVDNVPDAFAMEVTREGQLVLAVGGSIDGGNFKIKVPK